MNGFTFLNGTGCCLELRQGTLQVLDGERGLELPLERAPNGRLTEACKEKLVQRLKSFFKRGPWQPRPRALCAIPARGVSLRRLTVPATTRDNLQRVLLLQVEAEFPVAPDDLAWGYSPLGEVTERGNGEPAATQEILVAAIKKEAVQEYAQLLTECGVTPVFTLAALARSRLCPQPPPNYAVLDIGRNYSELISFENGVPTALRVLSWGGETITRALGEQLQIGRSEAESLKLKLQTGPPPNGEVGPKVQSALESALDALAGSLNGQTVGRKVFLTGKSIRQKDLAARLAGRMGPGAECQALEILGGEGRTAALVALQQLIQNGDSPLVLEVKPANGSAAVARPAPWKWVGIAAALGLGLMLVPYLEALFMKVHLAKKLAAIKTDTGRLAVIDRELDFLDYLKQTQPPYLDTLFIMAKSAPPGARLDSVSMSRRGELSWRGSLKDSQQVADFRSKLINSGLFVNVTVEEQTPTPDRQKLNVRMGAQWKALSSGQLLALGPSREEIEKARTNVHEQVFGPPMGGGFPGMGAPPMSTPAPGRRPARATPPPNIGAPMPVTPGGPNIPGGPAGPGGANP